MARLASIVVVSVPHRVAAKISIDILVPICYRYPSSVRASVSACPVYPEPLLWRREPLFRERGFADVSEGATVARLPLLLFDI
jgi:hypothetical protein